MLSLSKHREARRDWSNDRGVFIPARSHRNAAAQRLQTSEAACCTPSPPCERPRRLETPGRRCIVVTIRHALSVPTTRRESANGGATCPFHIARPPSRHRARRMTWKIGMVAPSVVSVDSGSFSSTGSTAQKPITGADPRVLPANHRLTAITSTFFITKETGRGLAETVDQ